MSLDLTNLFIALTLIFWGLTHFDLGRASRVIVIITGVCAILAGLCLLFVHQAVAL